jgi:hypothetical protein
MNSPTGLTGNRVHCGWSRFAEHSRAPVQIRTPPTGSGQLDIQAPLRYVELPMKDTLTITQGQAQFPASCRKEKTTAITRNGEVVSFIVPRRKMADLLEQMEILANPEAMKAINSARAGKTKDYPLSILDEDESNA